MKLGKNKQKEREMGKKKIRIQFCSYVVEAFIAKDTKRRSGGWWREASLSKYRQQPFKRFPILIEKSIRPSIDKEGLKECRKEKGVGGLWNSCLYKERIKRFLHSKGCMNRITKFSSASPLFFFFFLLAIISDYTKEIMHLTRMEFQCYKETSVFLKSNVY